MDTGASFAAGAAATGFAIGLTMPRSVAFRGMGAPGLAAAGGGIVDAALPAARLPISVRTSALRVAMALPASRSTSAATSAGDAIAVPSPSIAAASSATDGVRLPGSRSSAFFTASSSGVGTEIPAMVPSAAMGPVSTFCTMAASIFDVKSRCLERASQSTTPIENTSAVAASGGAAAAGEVMLLTRSGDAYERRSWFFTPTGAPRRERTPAVARPPRRATPSSPTSTWCGPSSPWWSGGSCPCAAPSAASTSRTMRRTTGCGIPWAPAAVTSPARDSPSWCSKATYSSPPAVPASTRATALGCRKVIPGFVSARTASAASGFLVRCLCTRTTAKSFGASAASPDVRAIHSVPTPIPGCSLSNSYVPSFEAGFSSVMASEC